MQEVVRTTVPKNILLIDKDEAFGTVMLEAIQESGDFAVKLFGSAAAALTALRQAPFDLVILDQGVDDLPLPHVIRGARMLRANIPVLIMPYDGSEVPQELASLGLQGALSKIFFRMDLPQKIESVLGLAPSAAAPATGAILPPVAPPHAARRTRPGASAATPREGGVGATTARAAAEPAAEAAPAVPGSASTETVDSPRVAEAATTPAPSHPARPPRTRATAPPAGTTAASGTPDARTKLELSGRVADEINFHLRALAKELSADAVLFIFGGELVGFAGMLSRARVVELAAALDGAWAAMHSLGVLAGNEDGAVQAFIEGKEHIVYTMRLGAHGALGVVAPAGTSPGSIRLRAREAANSIEMFAASS